jgi:hypothetical protein
LPFVVLSNAEAGNHHHVFVFSEPEPVQAMCLSARLKAFVLFVPGRLSFKERRYCILSRSEMPRVNVEKIWRYLIKLEEKFDALAPMNLEFAHWSIVSNWRQFAYIFTAIFAVKFHCTAQK